MSDWTIHLNELTPSITAGSSTDVHNGYQNEYGADALSFVNAAISSAPTTAC
jgi:hypothetical protein